MYFTGRPWIFMSRSSNAMRMPRSRIGPTSENAPVAGQMPRITSSLGCERMMAGKPSAAVAAPTFRISLRFMGLLPMNERERTPNRSSAVEVFRMDARAPRHDNRAVQHQRIASTAALLADPSRAAMVLALMDGRCRSAKKLALDAGVTAQTASTHLRKLVNAKMLVWQGRGRFKYFSLAGADVAQAVEALSEIGIRELPAGARELRFARCCYDHLAGQLGVAVTGRLL